MAKKTATKKREEKTTRTALVVPANTTLSVEQGFKVDLTVDLERLLKTFRTDARDFFVSQRKDIEDERTAAQVDYDRMAQELLEHAKRLADTLKGDPQATAAAEAISAFTGEAYTTRVEPSKCDSDLRQVTATIEVIRNRDIREDDHNERQYGYRSSSALLSRSVTKAFTAEMGQIVERLRAQADVVRGIEARLKKADRNLADLPQLTDRAESKLVKAVLAGEITTSNDMLAVLMSVNPNPQDQAALPAPRRK